MDSIRCPQCGKLLPRLARFCRRCGTVLALTPPPPPRQVLLPLPPPPPPPRPVPPPVSGPVRRPAPVKSSSGGGGLLLFLIIVAIIIYFNTHSRKSTPAFNPIQQNNAWDRGFPTRSYPSPWDKRGSTSQLPSPQSAVPSGYRIPELPKVPTFKIPELPRVPTTVTIPNPRTGGTTTYTIPYTYPNYYRPSTGPSKLSGPQSKLPAGPYTTPDAPVEYRPR